MAVFYKEKLTPDASGVRFYLMDNILEYLENTAALYGDKTAFIYPGMDISFGVLDRKARILGSMLISGDHILPVRTGEAVAFYMEKNVEALVCMFGTVYANGFYSFIDVRQPSDRAFKVLSLLDPALIITDDENEEALRAMAGIDIMSSRIVNINNIMSTISDKAPDDAALQDRRREFYDTLPLYVNFTSGSTGTPKGVVVGHRSVIDFITVFTDTFGIDSSDTLANQAPFDFDVSVKDIYSGIFTGATVCLIPRPYFTNPTVLMDYICDNDVTTVIWAVSAMCFVSIMNALDYRTPEKLDKIMFSGEIMPVKQLNKWKKYLPSATYVNLYGPTEITCNCTYHILDREYEKDELLPIGIPFRNEKVFLLDDNDMIVSDPGIEGEICVAGSCLALGYYKDPEKTAQVFTDNPVNKAFEERIYRTGDLGMYLEDGSLVYTSRKDFQIKHMGQRVELGEIEVSAMSLNDVSRACCLYDEKRQKLILFYSGGMDKEDVNEELKKKLPPYMIPQKTIPLDDFPMNKNGKIDRNALKELI